MYIMDHFEPVTITFDEKEYTVPEDKIWGLLKQLESVMSFNYLVHKLALNDVPSMSVYEAYAMALRYAGHPSVTPVEVAQKSKRADVMQMAYELVAILRMANPPEDMDIVADESGEASEEEVEGTKKKGQ